ncbi:hypothetical protein NG895_22860 [Aeoliella sp. ICT_H6.2]|uniref:Uncharacterized protein n=1 Tax=Aeoliella straminimaris TaxID=2954799 RepID=A0A9X2FEK9_9BACT|nr:hypothetical protein [Aeoliella straminimaris]MCO6046748.1 hypothetical protein [Aeoliella straminimaris]
MNDSNDQPLPCIGAMALAVVLHVVALVALVMVLVFVVPLLREVYAEMDLPLSPNVLWLVRLSQLAVSYWYALLGMGLIADIALVCLLGWTRFLADKVLPLVNYAVLLGTLLLVTMMMLVLMTPFG